MPTAAAAHRPCVTRSTTITNPDGTHVYFAYDSEGRLTGQSLDGGADGAVHGYGAFGGLTATDSRLNQSQTFLLDDLGELAAYVDTPGADHPPISRRRRET